MINKQMTSSDVKAIFPFSKVKFSRHYDLFLQVQLREVPKYVECEEDDLFRKDFERMMGDSVAERLNDNSKIPHVDIAIPMNLKGL